MLFTLKEVVPTFTNFPICAGAKIDPTAGFTGVATHLNEVTGVQVTFFVPLPELCPSLLHKVPFLGVAAKEFGVEGES
jgi:hypothetical protein